MSKNWAVCVGINSYDNIQSLNYAKQDAEAVASFFRKDACFEEVYFLAEDSGPIKSDFGQPIKSRPTFGNLMRFLRVRFEQPFLEASDNLWSFFAGHGRREREQDYLLPIDADPGSVSETGILVRYIIERLRRSGAGNVILLLDACRNEGARDGQGIGVERQKGAVTISSCSPAEFSYEIEALGHGAFTYGLLEALRLHGEHNCATVERLDRFLQVRVPEICRAYDKPRQTPCTFAEPLSKRHFILLPAVALPDDLEPLKIEALHAEAIGDFRLAEQLWWRINSVAPTDAQPREAIHRIALKVERGGVQRRQEDENDISENRNRVSTSSAQQVTVKGAREQQSRVIVGAGITRRHLQLYGGAAALGAISGAGYFGLPFLSRKTVPDIRTEMVEVPTVGVRGESYSIEWAEVSYFSVHLGANEAIDFSVLPAGEFSMGSPPGEEQRRENEGPVFMRTKPFAISRTAVTQAQWRAVVLAALKAIRWALPVAPSAFKGDLRPVESVSWQDASEFCSRLSALTGLRCRLPSEAEWEYACRARTTTPFHFGPTLTPDLANYCGTGGGVCGTSFGKDVASLYYNGVGYEYGFYALGPEGVFAATTKPVRTYPQNRFGLFEMHGNVWEHCMDNWSERLSDVPPDGSPFRKEASTLHVLRGGSWSHNAAICRSAYRESIGEASRGWEGRIGFRVVCEI